MTIAITATLRDEKGRLIRIYHGKPEDFRPGELTEAVLKSLGDAMVRHSEAVSKVLLSGPHHD